MFFRSFVVLLLLAAAVQASSQQVTLLGLRSANHAGAFRGLRADASGNLYTLYDAGDGVRLLKFNAAGTQLLGEAAFGQAGDSGVALDLDAAGYIYVAGTSNSLGSVTGTAGTAFPNRAGTATNSFVARFTPGLQQQWLTFCGAAPLAVSSVATTPSGVLVTGSIFAATLPVTSGGVQQSPAPASNANGFVESFDAGSGQLRYATYLTGANGDTAPAAIAADSTGNAYIAGTTTATGYPTTAALVPVFRAVGSNTAAGFVTKLNATGDGFLFSTFVPGNGLSSAALDSNGSGSLLVSGDISPGLFPLITVQQPIAPLLRYQTAFRLSLDGSAVLASTLLAPSTGSVITPAGSGTAWAFASVQNTAAVPLLPVLPVESLGNAFALRINAAGAVDRASRFGGVPVTNSGFSSLPAVEGGIAVLPGGTVGLSGSVLPTLSSDLLPTQTYDLPLASAPNAALPSGVRDALPPADCTGSACNGSAALLATLAPEANAPTLALSVDDQPNLTLRNLGTAAVSDLQITAVGFTVVSGCPATLPTAGECSLALTGSGPGTVTVRAGNAAAVTTALPAVSRALRSITVLPREVDFGIVASTSAVATRSLTISNLGPTTQTFSSVSGTLPGAGYALAEAASTCTPSGPAGMKVLAPGGTCTVTLALAAAPGGSPDGAVNAQWQVGGQDVQVTGYLQAGSLSLSATTVDFGRQFAGGIRSNRYLYLSNGSDRSVAHQSVRSSSAAFPLSDGCPAVLQPRAVCRIQLAYQAAGTTSSDAMALTVDGLQATVLGETLPQPSISGSATNPNLRVSPASITFANAVNITQASSESYAVTIRNAGTLAFPLQLAVAGDFSFASSCPASLGGGAGCTAVVSFTPSAAGARQGLLSVTAGSTAPAYVALSGVGTAILPAGSDTLAYGDVPLQTPSVQWLKVSQSFSTLTATSSDSDFAVVLVEDTGYGHGEPPSGAFSATASGSCLNCYLGVQFLPSSTGPRTGTVTLTSPGAGKPAAVALLGSGVPLTGLILTPASGDFGTVPVQSSSASTRFVLTNGTSAAITVSGVTLTGDFNATGESTGAASCSGGTLQPGAACLVAVRFTPSGSGIRAGRLTVSTSAGDAGSTLTGTGTDDPGLALSPGELRFDNVPGIDARQQTLRLTNTQDTTLTVGTPEVSDSHFTAAGTCGSLTPGAACDIRVTYTAGSFLASGTLVLPVTAAPAGAPSTSRYAVTLAGLYTADMAGLQIVPGEHATVHFGAAATGTPALSRVLHVNNLLGQAQTVQIEAPREFAVTASTCGGTVAANAGCDLVVQYTPLTSGDTTGTVFVRGTPADGSATQTALGYLQGYGVGGTASLAISGSISPTGVLLFGQIASGANTSRTVTLTNPAAATAVVTVRRIRSEFPFLSTSDCGAPLAPGQSCSVTVVYSPLFQTAPGSGQTGTQADTGTLTVESDGANAPQFVDLAGSATPAVVASPGNAAPVSAFTTSQGSLTFTSTAAGTPSATQTVTLANTGTATVRILGLVTSNGFRATGNCGTLVSGATCDIAVAYIPQNSAAALGSLEIQSDSSASLEFVSLLGTVVAPQNPGPVASISITPQSLAFGRVLVGRTATLPATVTNTSTLPVELGARSVTGSSFALAVNSTSCPAAGAVLPPGASCTVSLTFTPAGTGTLRGTLLLESSATEQPLTVALSGVGTEPQLGVAPLSLGFGNVPVGSTATQAVTLVNSSSLPADALRFTANAGYSVSSTCGITTIQAGSSCAVNVTFAPTAAGISTGLLTISSSDPASPLTVPLSGNGIEVTGVTVSALSATPSSLDFGAVSVGGSGSLSFTLSNPTAITAGSLLFSASAGFTVASSCGTALNAYSTCPVTVTFSPAAAGNATGTVMVQSSAGSAPLLVALSGSGTTQPAQLRATPGSLSFGNVPVGSSAVLPITLLNSGAAAINFLSITASNGFVSSGTCTANLGPGASCDVLVTFSPTVGGAATGALLVQSRDLTAPVFVALSGTGLLLPPQLSLTPTSLNFGSIAVGSSSTLTATLLNTSSTTVTRIAVAATSGFTVSNGCGAILAPGSSCPISVTYAPGGAGVLTGLLTVNSSDSSSPLIASLSGSGTVTGSGTGSFTLTVNGGSTASATVQAGLPASFALAITPVGGYTGTVALTCAADTPVEYAACSLLPSSVTLAGGAQAATVTINTVSAVNVGALTVPSRHSGALLCLSPALLLLLYRRRRPAALLVLLLGTVLVNGCGSGGDARIRYVAPGTYIFRVTASSTGGQTLSQTVNLNLTVTRR